MSGQQFLNETAQFFYTHASNVENLEKIEKRECEREFIEVEEDGILKNESTLKTGGRLKSNKLSNNDNEDDDDFPMTLEEPSAQVVEYSSSARELRLRLASMTKEEKDQWRNQALIPGTIPHAGKY